MDNKYNFIRKQIREIIKEVGFQGNYIPYTSVHNTQFPYNSEDVLIFTPDQIENQENTITKSTVSNQEFNLGVEIEKRIHPNFNTLEIKKLVSKNLDIDKEFYSKLKKPKP